tara:strand:+ start:1058 stop:2803 length:1746 start_codon:yes stop_codon:yes gene_type:complete
MAGKSNTSATFFSQKKLLGKAHTSNLKTDGEELIGSNIQAASSLLFGQSIPENPSQTLYLMQSASNGGPSTVEYVHFALTALTGTTYDANETSPDGGAGSDSGESSQSSGVHTYKFVFRSDYSSNSSNPKKGNGDFNNSKILHETLGRVQLIPPFFSQTAPNPYIVKIYKDDGAGGIGDEIPLLDNIDWNVDFYNGILFLQDFNGSKIPAHAKAFTYVGDFADKGFFENSLSGSLQQLTDGNSYLVAGSNVTISSASNGQITIASTGGGGGTPGGSNTHLQFNDGGSFGGDVDLTFNKTTNALETAGFVTASLGFSGSLTSLTDGTSYLVAGDNVTITSASNGQVTIASAIGITELSEDTSPELGGQLVTGDHKIAFGTGNNTSEIDFTYNGGGNFTSIASVKSIDMFLDLNGGDSGQKFRIFNNLQPASSYAGGTNTDANAIFMVREEGNVFTKGYVTASMGFSGSLTQLTDGSSYIKASSGISVSSASNGSITLKTSKEMVFNELLGGITNGTNTLFTLANTPFSSSEISIFVNGQLQTPPDLTTFQDYSVTGSNVYFTTGSIPEEGSIVLAMYNKVTS